MLVITRRKGEKIIIADNIEITILDSAQKKVRFGINAPKEITIHSRLKRSPSSGSEVAQDGKDEPLE
jgi:carbon storage regulator CsrA